MDLRKDLRKVLRTLYITGVVCLCLLPTMALCATYYLSPSGSDSANGTTTTTPLKTFSKAFSKMSSGDTLYLLNGTYSDAAGTGYMSYESTYGGDMPSGSSTSNMTTIRALNEGSVTVSSGTGGTGSYALFLGRSSTKLRYAKIQGITFIGGGTLYNTNHIYIKNCGFYGARQDGGDVFGIGTNDHSNGNTYNLVEDCWVWGKNRAIASNYLSDHNIWRRVVVRGDGCNSANCTGSGNPNIGITTYSSQYVSMQNVMIVDRILGGGEGYGNFATAEHGVSALTALEWLGCVSLNGPDLGAYFEGYNHANNSHTLRNFIIWGMASEGISMQPGDGGANFTGLVLENMTIGATTYGMYIGDTDSATIRNNIVTATSNTSLVLAVKPSYMDTYRASGDRYYDSTSTPTTGKFETNPRTTSPAGLKYLPRIETGSTIKGTGYGGGDYGATVLYKYGTDGTFYGDTGYNTLTVNALWPWPNEARIKTDFASVSGGARGFATGTSRDGSSQSLTKYIWEYLGNQIPSDIYSGTGSSQVNIVTGFRIVQ